MQWGLSVFCLAAVFSAVIGDVTKFSQCPGQYDQCTVQQIRITPCNSKRACKLRKGEDAAISFDFTPAFDANELVQGVYSPVSGQEVPFDAVTGDDTCQHTQCPARAGVQQTLNYSVNLSPKLPRGTFVLRWKVWSKEDPTKICCLETSVNLLEKRRNPSG